MEWFENTSNSVLNTTASLLIFKGFEIIECVYNPTYRLGAYANTGKLPVIKYGLVVFTL